MQTNWFYTVWPFTIVIFTLNEWRACMKPEPRGVALGLLIAGFALAVVLTIAQARPADLEAQV